MILTNGLHFYSLFELDIKTQNPIDKNFEDDLLQLFKSGSRKQLDQINILYEVTI